MAAIGCEVDVDRFAGLLDGDLFQQIDQCVAVEQLVAWDVAVLELMMQLGELFGMQVGMIGDVVYSVVVFEVAIRLQTYKSIYFLILMEMFDEGVYLCLLFEPIDVAAHLAINLAICDFEQDDLTHQFVQPIHLLFHSAWLSVY